MTRWILIDGIANSYKCPECKETSYFDYGELGDYCPKCGELMIWGKSLSCEEEEVLQRELLNRYIDGYYGALSEVEHIIDDVYDKYQILEEGYEELCERIEKLWEE